MQFSMIACLEPTLAPRQNGVRICSHPKAVGAAGRGDCEEGESHTSWKAQTVVLEDGSVMRTTQTHCEEGSILVTCLASPSHLPTTN